jgi:hypothetical protein
MKKYLILSFILTSLLFNCDDQLDRTPIDELVSETAFQTVSDLQFGLAGAIGNLSYTGIITHNSIFTDNCRVGVDNGGQQLNTVNQILDPDTGGQGIWANRYGFINDINRLIVAADGVTPAVNEVNQYNNILAQAYAFRALAHYEALLYFGFDMRDNSSEGVPYVDFVSTNALPARNTTGEVLEGIQNDLSRALALFPAGTNDINFATPDFVSFLRARIALETGDYPAAISASNAIISSYQLADPVQYFNMFNEDADTTEVIWRYDNVQGFNYNYGNIWIFTGTGGNFIEMSSELFNLLDPTDIRRQVLVAPSSNIAAEQYGIGKYPPNADTQYINDFKAMRVSEAYLIRAEAYARTGQFGLAANDVLAVRNARSLIGGATVTYNGVVDALTDILLERRLELAYEGHRYIDIKRMRDVLNQGITRDDADCLGAAPCTLAPTSEKWIFPVPQGEINANPNIIQAPNY